jgi:hypothetical protein
LRRLFGKRLVRTELRLAAKSLRENLAVN